VDAELIGAPVLGVARSATGRRWIWRDAEPRIAAGIAQRLSLPELVGRLLAVRGVGIEAASDWLDPTLRVLLPDPSVLSDMDAAAARIADAVERGETVGVFGDYDVDGACAGALMVRVLAALGCEVLSHVPHRITEGYGPNVTALRTLAERGATLIVCVDCGIAASSVFAELGGGSDIVVLDHHKAEGAVPSVVAVVNPNRLDDSSGLTGLCAAGVSFLASVAVLRTLRRRGYFASRREPDLIGLLDLVALATVCDVMPLTGVNRALVSQGLKVMARRERPGIAALLEIAGVRDAPSAHSCGFALGPRINAAGRIDDPGLGLRLLTTDDPVEARALAEKLDAVNRQRQLVEASMLEAALAQADAQAAAGHPAILVAGDGWHPGVVGIVAGRVKERLNRPACVAAVTEGEAKGSGRSVPGLDLGAAIIAARQAGILTSGGGHPMAAGFGLRAERMAEFHAFLCERLSAASALPAAADLPVEGTMAVAAATTDLAQMVGRLAPFGAGNEEPIFALPRARVVRADRVGREGNTVRAFVDAEEGGARLKAILFRGREGPLAELLLNERGSVHLAGHLRCESWNGSESACFVVADGVRV